MKKIVAVMLVPLIIVLDYLIKKKKIRVGLLDVSRIGHATSFASNYLIEKSLYKRKCLDIIFCSNQTANRFIKKKIAKKIFLIKLEKFYRGIVYAYKYWFGEEMGRIKFSINYLEKINLNKNLISFNSSEEKIKTVPVAGLQKYWLQNVNHRKI